MTDEEKITPEPILKLGKITITRIDAMNWAVAGDGNVAYYYNLSKAISNAAARAANHKAASIETWLTEYERISRKIEKFAQAIEEHEGITEWQASTKSTGKR